jgi:hypothetical protein
MSKRQGKKRNQPKKTTKKHLELHESLILYTIIYFGQAGCWDFKSALQWLLFSAERKPDFILGRPSALAPICFKPGPLNLNCGS